jgi:hypothetical protein
MTSTKRHTRVGETLHPEAVPFHVFIQQQTASAKPVDRVAARRWVMSSYKREALVRIGAQVIASSALRLQVVKQRETSKNSLTVAAIGFTQEGRSISASEADELYSRGLAVVFQRLVSARSQTYVYDKQLRVFLTSGAVEPLKLSSNKGTVKAIVSVLSVRNATASEIAAQYGVNVCSVRSILSRFLLQGRVRKVQRTKPGKGEVIWAIGEKSGNPTA